MRAGGSPIVAHEIADPALDEALAQTSRLITDLHDQIMSSRMVPVGQVFDRFPRLVRDAASRSARRSSFVIEGREIELDRSMLDEIGEPIVHLLRNAADHGIEQPDVRERAGKPRDGPAHARRHARAADGDDARRRTMDAASIATACSSARAREGWSRRDVPSR